MLGTGRNSRSTPISGEQIHVGQAAVPLLETLMNCMETRRVLIPTGFGESLNLGHCARSIAPVQTLSLSSHVYVYLDNMGCYLIIDKLLFLNYSYVDRPVVTFQIEDLSSGLGMLLQVMTD